MAGHPVVKIAQREWPCWNNDVPHTIQAGERYTAVRDSQSREVMRFCRRCTDVQQEVQS